MSLFSKEEGQILRNILEQPEFSCSCDDAAKECGTCPTYLEWEEKVVRIREKVWTGSYNMNYRRYPGARLVRAQQRRAQAQRTIDKLLERGP